MSPSIYPVKCLKRRKGKSKPHLIQCSDGHRYLVKLKNNPQGTRSLVNEYVVSKLGLLLGLPIPPASYIQISQSFIQSNPLFEKYDFVPGNQFASLYIDGCTALSKEEPFPVRDQIQNHAIIPGIFLFDIWVSNQDRWKNNILLQPVKEGKFYLYLIDHGDCFPEGREWTIKSLKKSPNLRKFRSVHQWCLEQIKSSQELYPFLDRIEHLPLDHIQMVVHSIPHDWDVSTKEKNALVQHLISGKQKLPALVHEYTTKFI